MRQPLNYPFQKDLAKVSGREISLFNWLCKRSAKKHRERDEVKEPLALKLVLGTLFIFAFIILVAFGASILLGHGYKHAERLDTFLVFTASFDSFKGDVAVIRTYGERVYAVPFKRDTTKTDQSGRKTVEFEKQLIIVNMYDIKAPLSSENIGHLQAKPKDENARDQSKK